MSTDQRQSHQQITIAGHRHKVSQKLFIVDALEIVSKSSPYPSFILRRAGTIDLLALDAMDQKPRPIELDFGLRSGQ